MRSVRTCVIDVIHAYDIAQNILAVLDERHDKCLCRLVVASPGMALGDADVAEARLGQRNGGGVPAWAAASDENICRRSLPHTPP
jgi:hypothetical protein